MKNLSMTLKSRAQHPTPEGTIIFVHGITGNSAETFTNSNSKFDWIDHVSKTFSNWNVAVVDYDSKIWSKITAVSAIDEGYSLVALSLELIHEIAEFQSLGEKLVFACHSMGGLLVKHIFDSSEDSLTGPILDKVTGVLFMGTPHYGAEIARRVAQFSDLLSSRLISDLTDTDYLKVLDKQFSKSCLNRNVAVVNFVEQLPIFARLKIVQTEEGYLEWLSRIRNIELPENHVQISKPHGVKSLQSRELVHLVERIFNNETGLINGFTHFLDHHYLEKAGYRNAFRAPRIEIFAEQAFKMCLLVCDNIFIHAGFYYESRLAKKFVDKYEPYFLGKIILFANAPDIEAYTETSQPRFQAGDKHQRAYIFRPEHARLEFVQSTESSTEVLKRAWLLTDPESILWDPDTGSIKNDANIRFSEWEHVPERIGRLAMIAQYITPIIAKIPSSILIGNIQTFTQNTYYQSIINRYNAKIFTDIPFMPPITPRPAQKNILNFNQIMRREKTVSRIITNTGKNALEELINFSRSDTCFEFQEKIRLEKLGHI